MTRPVADISLNIDAVDSSRSVARDRRSAPNADEAFGNEFASIVAGESRSPRSRPTAGEVFESPEDGPSGELSLAPRLPRGRQPGGLPEMPGTAGITSADPSGFVRSQSTEAPHLPRFESVPESAKFPSGPYRQAPAEFGGEWWMVSPFTGPEPWLRASPSQDSPVETLPNGFAEIFGHRPTRQQYPDYFEFRLAKIGWEQDLKHFKRAGMPEGMDTAQLAASEQAFQEWGLGKPVFYEGGQGWRVSFPESAVRGFEMNPQTALMAPHVVIATYQIRLLQQGGAPENLHPWIPPHLLTPAAEEA
jgi:hypothetical protein